VPNFRGTIPAGHYGAGEVSIWDHGTFENLDTAQSVTDGIAAGKLSFVLHGERLRGRYSLVRMRGGEGQRENWLLIKGRDEHARAEGEAEGDNHPPVKVRREHGESPTWPGASTPGDVKVADLDKTDAFLPKPAAPR
jgi:bifunctional non-homologous end joining protein LigD